MSPPLIGITTYGRDENNRFYLPAQYVDAVRRAGGIPLLLPPGEPHAESLLVQLEGLILTGGGDIDPSLYGGAPHPAIYMVDPERDKSEIALVQYSAQSALPTLGICRGSQVINVALGGTLIEHLPDAVGETIFHRLPPREPTQHSIRLTPGCRLAEILFQEEFLAPSWHHQAIRQPAPGLKVVGQAPDGTTEAVEMADHPWLIGVQWHPELAAADEPLHQKLFNGLVSAASEWKRR